MLHKEQRILSELDTFQLEKRLCRQHVYFISSFVNWKYSNCDFSVTVTGGLIDKYNKENSVKKCALRWKNDKVAQNKVE